MKAPIRAKGQSEDVEIRSAPPWYCFSIVLPMSTKLRSSKIMKLCFLEIAFKPCTVSSPKSDTMSLWVLKSAMYGPISITQELLVGYSIVITR